MAVPLCLRAARLRPRGAKGTGTSEPRDQTPRRLSEAGGAPRSGAELHERREEASRVDPEAGPVILTHMRGRLRTVVAGKRHDQGSFRTSIEAHWHRAGRAGGQGRGDSKSWWRSGSQASPSARRDFIMMSDDFS